MRIAIFGCGEVGYCYASVFAEVTDHTLLFCDQHPSVKAKALAEKLGVEIHLHPGSWLQTVDVIFLCVPGTISLEIVRLILPYVQKGTLIADFSTAAPADKRQASLEAERLGIKFVDVVIMGAISLLGAETPLLCAGKDSEQIVQIMRELKAPIRVLEEATPGDAASLKLLRTVFTKGLEALTVECLIAAEHQGVREKLYDILSDIGKSSLRDFLEMLLRTHVLHACRRRHEVQEAAKQLTLAGLPVQVLPGVETLFAKTCGDLEKTPLQLSNPTTDDAIAWLLKTRVES